MSPMLQRASKHWRFVAPLLSKPQSEEDYDALVAVLDELFKLIGDDEDHPLASLAIILGDLIEAYDESQRPMPDVRGIDALRYLMEEHKLTQGDLPEIGTQSVVSETLSGKRQLNVRQIRALAERFHVPVDVFL